MEENHNKNNRNLNLGSENSIDLKSKLPDWLMGFFSPSTIGTVADINGDLLEGYPNDDDF